MLLREDKKYSWNNRCHQGNKLDQNMVSNCHLKSDSQHDAASAYADAGHCFNSKESLSCLQQSMNLFMEMRRLNMAARYFKEIAEIYEFEQNFEQAIVYYERAADLFQSEDGSTSANQCRQKIAQFAAQLEHCHRKFNSQSKFFKLCRPWEIPI